MAGGARRTCSETSPPWYERIRYPLHYSEYIRVHAKRAQSRPGADGGGDLPGVEVQADGRVVVGRDRAHAADARRPRAASRSAPAAARSTTSDLYNPEINIRYGAWYLDNLFAKYHDERLVLAAYNAGQGNVDRWLARDEAIQFPETRAYVTRVEHLKQVYADAWRSQLYQ